jgi:hypothetical protein
VNSGLIFFIILTLVSCKFKYNNELKSGASHKKCSNRPIQIKVDDALACTTLGQFIEHNSGRLPISPEDLRRSLLNFGKVEESMIAYSQAPRATNPRCPRGVFGVQAHSNFDETIPVNERLYFGVNYDAEGCIKVVEFITWSFEKGSFEFGEVEPGHSAPKFTKDFCVQCHRNENTIFQGFFWMNSFNNLSFPMALLKYTSENGGPHQAMWKEIELLQKEERDLLLSENGATEIKGALREECVIDDRLNSREMKSKLLSFKYLGMTPFRDNLENGADDFDNLVRGGVGVGEKPGLCQILSDRGAGDVQLKKTVALFHLKRLFSLTGPPSGQADQGQIFQAVEKLRQDQVEKIRKLPYRLNPTLKQYEPRSNISAENGSTMGNKVAAFYANCTNDEIDKLVNEMKKGCPKTDIPANFKPGTLKGFSFSNLRFAPIDKRDIVLALTSKNNFIFSSGIQRFDIQILKDMVNKIIASSRGRLNPLEAKQFILESLTSPAVQSALESATCMPYKALFHNAFIHGVKQTLAKRNITDSQIDTVLKEANIRDSCGEVLSRRSKRSPFFRAQVPENNVHPCIGCHNGAQNPDFSSWNRQGFDVMKISDWNRYFSGKINTSLKGEISENFDLIRDYMNSGYMPPQEQIKKWHSVGQLLDNPWRKVLKYIKNG